MPAIRALAKIACVTAFCVSLHAQTVNTISIRLLDGKTGLPVKASNFLVKVDHHDTEHNEWVRMNDDGTVMVTVPADAKELSVKATYNESMDTYINCDAAKENDRERDIWYPISDILKSGRGGAQRMQQNKLHRQARRVCVLCAEAGLAGSAGRLG